jgi:hypothetical protein
MKRMRTHDRRAVVRAATFVLGCTTLAACASEVPPAPAPMPVPAQGPVATSLQSAIDAALTDAARRTGLKQTELEVLSAEAVTWSDGSLGCPQPGMMYTQALVPGYRVRIRAGGNELDYHAGRTGAPVFCPAGRAVPPVSDDAAI